ncbi:RdgB/HAM1 family non-canonical purine NTP pyrophosphatase [Butyricicoccus porcorum]|uniref:dITP/XTP pyrophosphatase n=1 Tax=Butyricicoccus porcorum TaxID=1945634 RepID=A0A252F7F3_9FIRM|nr:RdgB/HAM1 family non-canonical purine NTP pyrophosphatase [Butyricicoccus porcorum]MCI6927510.1 RdgB/HAM1 family non-canonical purine NTP pyrophosphatase [Butyricicoccus porcorum]MDD6986248.1 RdgB/HAM1 family non-canonical purine NTP pyrophosphatase [Butyricicoccus porcorum]MDY4483008.1 RdgB/HAM1 family non-canonical purine NTP pyrophosphatase [Butyricicoccus porcorum]OUM21703.1 non-canonical purine NTP pyrophosphatase, RdgB/HAM1 family [Butyricicoccus porcorum]
MKFVLASHNKGKIQEVKQIWEPMGFEVVPMPKDFPEIEENGESFEENAMMKARAVSKALGLPAVADDSGLVVDALDGFPGIYSARWAGPDATAHDRNLLLLEKLMAVPEDQRGAEFVCVAACVFPDGKELTVRGQCRGTILNEEHGNGGFGYDPIFCVPKYGCTFGELDPEVKNSISHRARAFTALGSALRVYMEEKGEN